MITLDDIKKKAIRNYAKVLSSLIYGESIFPLVITGKKGNNISLLNRIEGMKKIYDGSKNKLGYGYTIETITKNKKGEGEQTLISKILFNNPKDYLHFLGKVDECNIFLDSIKKLEPYNLNSLFIDKPMILINNLNIVDDVIKVLDYFINNSVKGLYLRELPIDVDTKFIERNKGFVSKLLDIVLPDDRINFDHKDFSKRYGLKYDDNFYIHIRSLDPDIKINGFKEIALPLTEANSINIKPKKIFIVENRVNYLIYPQNKESIIIWGMGRAVTLLRDLDFFDGAKLFYWGDIDPTGFEILNSLRFYYQSVESLYMDSVTLEEYSSFIVEIKGFKKMKLEYLSKDELILYHSLFKNDYQIRLEQENIRIRTGSKL